jgi:hypothetical protein
MEGLSVETVSRDGSCQFPHCIFNTYFTGVKNIVRCVLILLVLEWWHYVEAVWYADILVSLAIIILMVKALNSHEIGQLGSQKYGTLSHHSRVSSPINKSQIATNSHEMYFVIHFNII